MESMFRKEKGNMMVTIDKEMFKDLSDSMEKENAQVGVPVINDVDAAEDKPEKKWTMGPIIVGAVVLAVVVTAMLVIAYVI